MDLVAAAELGAIDAEVSPGIPQGSISPKSASVDADVEGDPVVGDPPLDAHAERADLARQRPVASTQQPG